MLVACQARPCVTTRDMRFQVAALWVCVLVSSCAPVREDPPAAPVASILASQESAAPEEILASSPAAEPLRPTIAVFSGITFEGVAFDSRSYGLRVVDQAAGPGSEFSDAAAAARSRGGVAAVNGGFFTPEGEPLGWVIAGGRRSGGWNASSSLGSGIWHVDSAGRSAISRREKIGRDGASQMRELLQSGPLLVEAGRPVSGLDPGKSSVRTLILWDGGTRWWIGRASAASLAETGAVLARQGPARWSVRHALNLDGGRSADLWMASGPDGGPVSRRRAWNRPVRNFLVLVPK